jgi:hypothetical protein
MPKKTNDNKAKWAGYANISIPQTHEDKVLEYIKDSDNVWLKLTAALDEGYQIKFAKDVENDTVRCNMYASLKGMENAGLSLGGFGSDWYTALAVVMYKHHEIAKELWEGYEKPIDRKFG